MARPLVVNGYSAGWVGKGFPWVYRNEVIAGAADSGRMRPVQDQRGRTLGTAICDSGWIAARIYRQDAGPLDRDWLWSVLDRSAALRDRVVPPDTSGYRLVNGENDGLPGIRVDWWDHWAVVVADTPAVASLLDGLYAWLEDRRSPRGIVLCYRPDARDDRDFSAIEPKPGLVRGRPPTGAVRVKERGLLFDILPLDGPDVGLYADMREVRAWLEPHWGGTSVCNTFAYTGAFSVAAAFNGASEVVSVDLSRKYLDRAEANFRANGLDPEGFGFEARDTFKALDFWRRKGRTFDRVVLDPPSFSRSSGGTWSAKRDYPRLVASACRVMERDGWLIAASNQGDLSPKQFGGFIADGVRKAGRRARLLWWGGQGPDFPAALWFPEGRYLKVGIYEID